MKEIIVLSSQNYQDSKESNHGDCFLINTGNSLFIYDCGSNQHAESVLSYMKENNFKTAEFILSHNDDDHFLGLPLLLEHKKISKIHTVLLLKHVDDILEAIDDGRKTRESVKKKYSKNTITLLSFLVAIYATFTIPPTTYAILYIQISILLDQPMTI